MSSEEVLARIQSSLKEGADLRLQVADRCASTIARAAKHIADCLRTGGKLLFFGNGGSAADAQHLAAEFVGRFVKERKALPAIALTTDSSILTAIGNDYSFDLIFSRQIEAFGNKGDIAIGISTSGNSPNIVKGLQVAKERSLITIGLTGKTGGIVADLVDVPIVIPSANTARIQECHIAVGHIFCEIVEYYLF